MNAVYKENDVDKNYICFNAIKEIDSIYQELEQLLFNITTNLSFESHITTLSKKLITAIKDNRDLALATIMVNKFNLYTIKHSIDTAILSFIVAESMNKNNEDKLAIVNACFTMNLGMLKEHQQFQEHELLTESQKMIIHNHPIQSVNILQNIGITDQLWLTHVADHHACDIEKYPNSKPKNKILESTKIIFIADRYCALVSGRKYRKPFLPNSAIHYILTTAKNVIEPALAVCFIKELGMYPPGTSVKLSNGEIAIVSFKTDKKMCPIVHSIVDGSGTVLKNPIRRDTQLEGFRIREVLLESLLNPEDITKIWITS